MGYTPSSGPRFFLFLEQASFVALSIILGSPYYYMYIFMGSSTCNLPLEHHGVERGIECGEGVEPEDPWISVASDYNRFISFVRDCESVMMDDVFYLI